MTEGGYDTASFIYTVRAAADSAYGPPKYWLRYFSPSPNHGVDYNQTSAQDECRDDWDSGAKRLSPITRPPLSHYGGTSAQGLADAQAFVNALVTVYYWVAPLLMPSSQQLRCWLDQESGTAMGTGFWGGWSDYVNSYAWSGYGEPLFACLYCNPCAGAGHNCTTVVSSGYCWHVWSSTPETSTTCGHDLRSLPSWGPNSCATCTSNGPSTTLWQFAEHGVCGLSVNVDMDMGDLSAYALNILTRP